VLIPSIDVMEGQIVQLVQGERKALAFDDFTVWVERFRNFPIVQVIDLDAAMGRGNNSARIAELCAELPCQVGGGVRTLARAEELIAQGARKVIVGSSLFAFADGSAGVNATLAQQLADSIGRERLIFAVDSRNGKVAVKGWSEDSGIATTEAMRQLESCCSAFLYTHIETEGLMQGFPFSVLPSLQATTNNRLIVAGGISSADEVEHLDRMAIDAVVGMAIYTGALRV
jgi:phosphoribosylformimino-5-aminoimidazole carboxamide ribotide isomerase